MVSDSYIYEVEQLQAKSRLREEQKDAEIERLRAEIEPLRIALGLLTTIKPTMEIDVTDPVGMAQQIAVHVADEIERLRQQRNDFAASAIKRDDEIERLRVENEGLKLAVKMRPLPEYRDDPRLHEIIEEQRAEIERLRELAALREKQLDTHIAAMLKQDAEIERLREENSTFSDSLAAKADRIDRLGETVARQVAEIERLRLQSCQCGEDEACKYVQEIERLKAEIERRDEGIAQQVLDQKIEIERLREMNVNLQTAFDEVNEEMQRFGELLRTENRRIVEREKEIERLRSALREILERTRDPVIQAIAMDALGE